MKKYMLYVGIVLLLSQGLINCSQEKETDLSIADLKINYKEAVRIQNEVENDLNLVEKYIETEGSTQAGLNLLAQAKGNADKINRIIERLNRNIEKKS